MKIFAIDVKWQDYKPSNVLDWLGIDYTSIKSLKSIPNRPKDICLASQKQFGDGTIERFDWNKGIPNAIEELSSKSAQRTTDLIKKLQLEPQLLRNFGRRFE